MAEMQEMIAKSEAEEPEPVAEEPPAETAAADGDTPGDEPESVTEPEPAEATALDRIQRAEEKSRAKIAEERAAFAQEIEEIKPHLEEFREFKSLRDGVKRGDVAGVLRALGFNFETDSTTAARQIWALGPDAQKDPRHRAMAQKAIRERKTMTELEEVKAQNQKLLERIDNWEQQSAMTQKADAYMAELNESVTMESSPLVARLREKDSSKAMNRLTDAAIHLIDKTGEQPSHRAVAEFLENQLRQELDSLGIDVKSILQTAEPVAEPKPAAKPEKKPEPVQKTGEEKPPENLSEAELDERLVRELEDLVRQKNT